ncbi:MAG: N-acetyltransferase, partial [Gemmatimonadota bacterium]
MSSAVVVRPVETAADLKKFIAFPYRLHRGDPNWVPPLRMDIRKLLSRKKNPFFNHADAQYFLATSQGDGQIVGRIAAIHNRRHNEFHEDAVGFFGFFDCAENQDAARALLDTAADWLKQRGLEKMRGPASFSTNDECGLLVDGFETPATVLNPHNPRYYVDLLENSGMTKSMDMYQYQTVSPQLPERLMRGARLIMQRKKITLRGLDIKNFDEEIEKIKKIYNAA